MTWGSKLKVEKPQRNLQGLLLRWPWQTVAAPAGWSDPCMSVLHPVLGAWVVLLPLPPAPRPPPPCKIGLWNTTNRKASLLRDWDVGSYSTFQEFWNTDGNINNASESSATASPSETIITITLFPSLQGRCIHHRMSRVIVVSRCVFWIWEKRER